MKNFFVVSIIALFAFQAAYANPLSLNERLRELYKENEAEVNLLAEKVEKIRAQVGVDADEIKAQVTLAVDETLAHLREKLSEDHLTPLRQMLGERVKLLTAEIAIQAADTSLNSLEIIQASLTRVRDALREISEKAGKTDTAFPSDIRELEHALDSLFPKPLEIWDMILNNVQKFLPNLRDEKYHNLTNKLQENINKLKQSVDNLREKFHKKENQD